MTTIASLNGPVTVQNGFGGPSRTAAEIAQINSALAAALAEIGATSGGGGGIASVDPKSSFLILAGDSKTFLLTQNDGFNSRMAQLAATGGPFEGLTGWVNMGSSGYTLDGFVNDALAGDWVGPASDRANWNFAGTKTGDYASVATPLANLLAFVATIEDHIHPIICLGHDYNDFALYAANGNLNAADRLDYMLSRLRTAVEAIHEARPNALIVLVTPHILLARPYGDVIPSPTAFPTFGDVLATDAALVGGWNDTWEDSKRQIVAEYAYAIGWNWRRVEGEPDPLTVSADDLTSRADLAHEHYSMANWLCDDIVQILTGKALDPPIGRGKFADAMAEENSGYALTYDPRYCELHPERFTRVVADSLIGIGSNYMDIGIPYGDFAAAVQGTNPIYVQIGNDYGQVFSGYGAGASGGNTRLISVAPSAAMQTAATGLDVYVYIPRSTSTGDDYLDPLKFNASSYRKTYPCSLAAGNGYIDMTFTAVDGLFRIDTLRTVAGLSLAIGGGVDATLDLSDGWAISIWNPAARLIRIGKTGNHSAYNGKAALVLVNQSATDPKSREAPYVVAAANRLSELYAMSHVGGYQPNCTTVTVSTGIAVASDVTVEAFVFASNLRTSLGSATITANAINATITHASRTWEPGESLELVVTSPGSYAGLARVSGICA